MSRWLPDSSQAIVYGEWRSVNNLSGYEGRIVRYSAGVVLASSTTSACLGVLTNGGEASAVNVGVAIGGYTQMIAGDNVSPGDYLVPDASSRGTLSGFTSAINYSVRTLMSGASGDAVRVAVVPAWRF